MFFVLPMQSEVRSSPRRGRGDPTEKARDAAPSGGSPTLWTPSTPPPAFPPTPPHRTSTHPPLRPLQRPDASASTPSPPPWARARPRPRP